LIAMKNVELFRWFYQVKESQERSVLTHMDRERLLASDESIYYEISMSIAAYISPEYLSSHDKIPIPRAEIIASLSPEDRWWQYVGWEMNEKGKPGARIADLSSTANPIAHYEQAIDLNLRLMKWRQWPDMLLSNIQETKCLLLGMGTLGCAVARTLLGMMN